MDAFSKNASSSAFFGYDGLPHPGSLSWLAICFFSLIVQSNLLLRHLRSKPPVMVSLVDLVNADLVAANLFMSLNVLPPYAVANLGLRVPNIMVAMATLIIPFSLQTVLVYLTLAAIVQFTLARLRATSLVDSLTDEKTRATIRALVLLSSLAANAVRIWGDPLYRKTLNLSLYHPMASEAINVERNFQVALWFYGGLMLLCVISNVVLRVWMRRAKKKNLQEISIVNNLVTTDGSTPPQPLQPHAGHMIGSSNVLAGHTWLIVVIGTTLVLVGTFVSSQLQLRLRQGRPIAPFLRLFGAISATCIVMPLSLVISEKTLRMVLVEKTRNLFSKWKAKVGPILDA